MTTEVLFPLAYGRLSPDASCSLSLSFTYPWRRLALADSDGDGFSRTERAQRKFEKYKIEHIKARRYVGPNFAILVTGLDWAID